MSWFRDLKMTHKLVSSVLVVLAFTVALGGFAVVRLQALADHDAKVASDYLPGIITMARISEGAARFRRTCLQHLLADTREKKERLARDVLAFLGQDVRGTSEDRSPSAIPLTS